MKNLLEQICIDNPESIKSAVAQEALEYDDPQSFFDDLLQHGCISGMVSSLIYYADTHGFYDKHYEEIEELRTEYEESIGESLQINNDLKNYLAWFAFEQVAYQLVNEFVFD